MEREDSLTGMLVTWPSTSILSQTRSNTKDWEWSVVRHELYVHAFFVRTVGTILAAAEKYNRAVAQVSGANPNSWDGEQQYVSTDKNAHKHTCVCGKSLASVYALKNHVVEGWTGSSDDRSPECRPRLGIAYIISDASHQNPY